MITFLQSISVSQCLVLDVLDGLYGVPVGDIHHNQSYGGGRESLYKSSMRSGHDIPVGNGRLHQPQHLEKSCLCCHVENIQGVAVVHVVLWLHLVDLDISTDFVRGG